MLQYLIKILCALAKHVSRKIGQRQGFIRIGGEAFVKIAFLFVHSNVPAAVQPHLIKAVPVVTVISFGILHLKDRALHVAVKRSRHEMHRRGVARTAKVQLSVIKLLLAYPIVKSDGVLSFVNIL